MQGPSYRALEALPKTLPPRPGLHSWSQLGGTWAKGWGSGWGSQKPGLHIAQHPSFNPDSTLPSWVTSSKKLRPVTSSLKNLMFLCVAKPGKSPTSKSCWDAETG